MNRYLTEFCGVFFWVLCLGCVSIAAGAGTMPAIAIGAVVAVMVALGWGISGAHYNPAVSLSLWRAGLLQSKELVPYVIFQFLGAGAGAAVVKVIKSGFKAGSMEPKVLPALLVEFLFTLLLCYAMIHLHKQRDKWSALAGGAMIGGLVMAGVFAAGAVSGASLNPATALGSCVMGLLSFKSLWVFLFAHAVAGVVAPMAYRGLNPKL